MTRSGEAFLTALRDDRSVIVDGLRVEDVTTHPGLRGAAASLARLYDIAPCCETNVAFLIQRRRDELVARRIAHKRWADASYGLLGRSPDHVASLLTGFAAAAPFFGQFADNVVRFHERAAREDLYLAYAIVHPTVDRN